MFFFCYSLLPSSGENFGKYLKVGVVEDEDMKDELAGLCRFFSKDHDDSIVSFEEYISEMEVSAALRLGSTAWGGGVRASLEQPPSTVLISPVQLTTSRIGNLTRLILTLAICDNHTYIHTYIHMPYQSRERDVNRQGCRVRLEGRRYSTPFSFRPSHVLICS